MGQEGQEAGGRQAAMASTGPTDTLLISRNIPPLIGGSVTVYDALARALAPRILVLTGAEDPQTGLPFAREALEDETLGYPVHRIRRLRPPVTKGAAGGFARRLFSFLLRDLPTMLRVLAASLRLILRYRIRNVVIGELVYGGWLVFPLRYLFGRRVILYCHGEEIATEAESFADRLRPLYLRHAHGIVAVSAFCKSLIVSQHAIAPERIAVVPNGVREEAFAAAGQPPPSVASFWDGASHRLVALGRLVARKGHMVLLDAFLRVAEAFPGARLAILGDGPLRKRLEARIAETGLAGRVRIFPGLQDAAVRAVLHAADLFVLPTRTMPDGDTEGFGLVFLEAGAAGLPVVAGAAGGTVEAVIDGKTGLLVNGADAAAVSEAIIHLLADSRLARRMGAAGRRAARAAGWHRRARQLAGLLDGSGVFAEPRPHYTPRRERAAAGMPGTPPRLLLTVDCEECFPWTQRTPKGWWLAGQKELAAFHEALGAYSIRPLYLLTHPVLEDEAFSTLFAAWRQAGRADLGIHNHPWVTPPIFEWLNAYNSYPCNLPAHLEEAKIARLLALFRTRFKSAPLAYRAGRWGGSDRTPELLSQAGIPLDLSPAAHMLPAADGGPDHARLGPHPWRAGGQRDVLVLPAAGVLWPRGPDGLAFFAGSMRPFLRPQRFSPEMHPLSRLRRMAVAIEKTGTPVVCLSLHASSLVAGGNPYARDADAARRIFQRSLALLAHLVRDRGWQPISAPELVRMNGLRPAGPQAHADAQPEGMA